MRKIIFPVIAVFAALLAAGCAGPEQKISRGINNTWEIVRLGEMRRSIEQNTIVYPDGGFTYGVIHGFDRSIERTGLGLYETVTFPIPPYHPVLTKDFSPNPVYPDSYKPGVPDDPLFETDTYSGFSGGDIAPLVPGSRFNVFD